MLLFLSFGPLCVRACVCVCARKVPLALMEEGLVDATVVAGVLSPKGKASPQEEPLFKIKAAAEAFRDMRKLIAEALEVREGRRASVRKNPHTEWYQGVLFFCPPGTAV